jgi:hypothetical protein
MVDISLPRGDYGYTLEFTVLDSAGTAIDLTTYDVTLKVWRGSLIAPLIINGACVKTVPASGVCTYELALGDLATPGLYNVELELTRAGAIESTKTYTLEITNSP